MSRAVSLTRCLADLAATFIELCAVRLPRVDEITLFDCQIAARH